MYTWALVQRHSLLRPLSSYTVFSDFSPVFTLYVCVRVFDVIYAKLG